jgi:hypothetical protein
VVEEVGDFLFFGTDGQQFQQSNPFDCHYSSAV